MKRSISALLILIFVALVPAAPSLAGSRYHSYSNHYSGGYGSHYYPYRSYSHHHSDRFLTHLGVGLLAGAVVGSILYQPPPPRTVVYTAPPPVIVQSNPIVVRQQPAYYSSPPPAESVLREVKSTVQMLNVRSGPGLDEEVIGQAGLGEVLGVIGAAPEWLYIITEEGRRGWVMTQYTQNVDGPLG